MQDYCRSGISKRLCNARSLITCALAEVLQILFKDVFVSEISSVSISSLSKITVLGHCIFSCFHVIKAKFMELAMYYCKFACLSSFCLISLQDVKVISATCTTDLGEESYLDVSTSNLKEYKCSCKRSNNNAQCILHYLACPIQAP